MKTPAQEVFEKIKTLSDVEKLAIVDSILNDLDRPDPEIDRIWAEESRSRWREYREGRVNHISYAEIMTKYRRT
ncbi:MAG TPA: addiction module protein [Candidatus Brocadiia bacterium]|nr:addiction module protein [Candidatus Brocadiia bacterium]